MSGSCLPPARERTELPARRGPDLTEAWDREWQRRLSDPASRIQVLRWHRDDARLRPFTTLPELLEATGRALPQADADAVLASVVRLAAADDLAAHLVMRRLLPGLLKIALRRGARPGGRPKSHFGDLTAASWLNVRTYRLDRRPTKIAVNLLRDAEYHVFVQPYRLRQAQERPATADDHLPSAQADLHGRVTSRPWHAGDELHHVLEQGRAAGIDEADLQLLRWLYLEARPVHEVAAELAVSPRTVLSRRLAATDRLRRIAA